jgi:hypothetical protein
VGIAQTLALTATTLTVSDGNSVELGAIHDGEYVNVSGDAITGSLQITADFRADASPLVLRAEHPSHPGIIIDSFADGVEINSARTGVRATASGGAKRLLRALDPEQRGGRAIPCRRPRRPGCRGRRDGGRQ